jgi:hypothetical protein
MISEAGKRSLISEPNDSINEDALVESILPSKEMVISPSLLSEISYRQDEISLKPSIRLVKN